MKMELREINVIISIMCTVVTTAITAPTVTNEQTITTKVSRRSKGHGIRHFSRFRNFMLALLEDDDNKVGTENDLMDTILPPKNIFQNQHQIKKKNHKSKKSKKWHHEDNKLYNDACKAKNQFETVTTGTNQDMETVEVLPDTWVWTSKCVRPKSKCHNYGYGVDTQCQQKSGWVQVFARLSPDHEWKPQWIVVESGCSCGIRRTA